MWGFCFSLKDSVTEQTKNNFITKPSKSLHHKLKHNIQSCTDSKTKITRWQNLFLSLDDNSNGRPFLPTNSWRALKQRLLRTPELALVSLAGTRCINSQIPVFKLSINSELSVSSLSQKVVMKSSYCSNPLKTTSLLYFPLSQ